jgi:hypothetical protein
MPKLFAAIDETNDGMYLAFVVGNEESISANVKVLPTNFTHISSTLYPKPQKKMIVSKLNFSGGILVYCVRFGIPKLKNTIERNRMPKSKVDRKISYSIISKINKMYSSFVISNGMHIQDIPFEVDNNMVMGYLKDGGLKYSKPTNIHKLADCVAYANLCGWYIEGNVKEEGNEFEQKFHQQVLSSFN